MPTVGTTVLIGLRYDAEFGRYTASACSLMALPPRMHEMDEELIDLVHHYYGDGKPPEAVVCRKEGYGLLWGVMRALGLFAVTVHFGRGA